MAIDINAHPGNPHASKAQKAFDENRVSHGQAMDAAAIGFQNTMGTVCDLLHGMVEIPCHTRNGAAAASAFVNADLVLGGYTNFIPLDETVDAVAGAISAPYLSLHGIDPGPGYADWLTGRIASATVEVWPDLGHYPQLVERDRFVQRVLDFDPAR